MNCIVTVRSHTRFAVHLPFEARPSREEIKNAIRDVLPGDEQEGIRVELYHRVNDGNYTCFNTARVEQGASK